MPETPVFSAVNDRGVATLTLNRPGKHNAFDDRLVEALCGALERLTRTKAVRCLVLGAVGTSFCAGADLEWMRRAARYRRARNLADAEALAALMRRLATFPHPTIAQVQGAAYGGGVGLVACCDIAVASDKARFCVSETKLGLIPAVISPYLCAAIGARAARRYVLTAEPFDAHAALALGLVHEVVAPAVLEPRVREMCDTLLENSPQALIAAKRLVEAVAQRPVDDPLLRDTAERIAAQRASAEGREGVSAFLEKRLPAWRKA